MTFLAFAALLLPTAGAEVFKWADDRGEVHYGDSPPHDRDVESIRVPSPSSESMALGTGLSQEILQNLSRAPDSTEVREKEKRTIAPSKQEREERCFQAQRQLPVLELGRPIFYLDETGNRVVMDAEMRAKKMARLQEVVKDNCR